MHRSKKNDVKSAMALELSPAKLVVGEEASIKIQETAKSKVLVVELAAEPEEGPARLAAVKAGNS